LVSEREVADHSVADLDKAVPLVLPIALLWDAEDIVDEFVEAPGDPYALDEGAQGQPFEAEEAFLDEGGRVLADGKRGSNMGEDVPRARLGQCYWRLGVPSAG
jgi:hypothetical protein